MTPRRRVPRMRIDLRPSLILAGALGFGYVAAIVATAVALSETRFVLPACALLLVHGCWTIRSQALLRHSRSIICLELSGEDECIAQRRDHRLLRCRLAPSSYLTPWLIVLTLEREGRSLATHVVMMPDSSSGEMLRRLRVRLRWSRVGRLGRS